MGGADHSCIVRNLINGMGYISFAPGATEVAIGSSLLPYNRVGALDCPELLLFWKWVALLITVVITTAHAQDMHDQAGDSVRDRKTVPLVMGDAPARISLMVCTCLWSVVCCLFWEVGAFALVLVGSLAIVVSIRTCALRTAKADKRTFLLWNGWITSVYMLPILKHWF